MVQDNREDSYVVMDPNKKSVIALRESYRSPQHSLPSQPSIFRQFTVREVITPTKKGNISMKEVSFSFSDGNEWFPSFSPFKDCVSSFQETCSSRSRIKYDCPLKKAKVDSEFSGKRKSRRHEKESNDFRKEVPKLPKMHILIFSLLLVLSSILYVTIAPFEGRKSEQERPNQEWPIKDLTESLKDKVYGQDEAITCLLSFFEKKLLKQGETDLPIILITGSHPVGKSSVTSILASFLPPPGKAELVFFPPPSPEEVLTKCSTKSLNMIVVDSLEPHSVKGVLKWIPDFFYEAIQQNKPVFLVLVFNVQTWSGDSSLETVNITPDVLRASGIAIHKKLKSFGFNSHHVHFNPF